MMYIIKKRLFFFFITCLLFSNLTMLSVEKNFIKRKLQYGWATAKIIVGTLGIAGLYSIHNYYIDKYGFDGYRLILNKKYSDNLQRKVEYWGLHVGGYCTAFSTLISGLHDINTLINEKKYE